MALKPCTSLVDLLIRASQAGGDRGVVFCKKRAPDRIRSYAEFFERARGGAAWLQDQRVPKGSVLILQVGSSERQVELFWAAILSGIVPVLLPKATSLRQDDGSSQNVDAPRRLQGICRLIPDPIVVADADQSATSGNEKV